MGRKRLGVIFIYNQLGETQCVNVKNVVVTSVKIVGVVADSLSCKTQHTYY